MGVESGGEEEANDEESSRFRFFQDRYCERDGREITDSIPAATSTS